MKKRIYIKQWNKIKPYQKSDNTDTFYLKVANTLYKELSYYSKNLSGLMNNEEQLDFSCFLTAYFEDVISETYIFQTVVKHFKQIYGKELYEFFGDEEYFKDEINISDLKLLSWIYINLKVEDRYIGFQTEFFDMIAHSAYTLFDEYWESAPMNENLKSFYTFRSTSDYYQIRGYMKKLFLDSYLFKHDTALQLDDIVDTIFSEMDTVDLNICGYILHTQTDKMIVDSRSRILALSGREVLAHYVGEEHKNHKDILNISERLEGNFLYKNKDSRYIYLEHIASGHPVKLLKSSYDDYEKFYDNCILHMGMVKWQGDWWFTGNSIIKPYDFDLILDEKNDISARKIGNILVDQNKLQETANLHKKAFLEINNNHTFAFIKGNEVNDFIEKFINYFNDKLKPSKKENAESKKRAKENGYLNDDSNLNFDKEDEVIIYFNPKSGMEMGLNLSAAFPEENNPFFNKNEMDEDFETILFSDDFSTEMVNHLITHHKDKFTFVKNRTAEEIDMIIRFYKHKVYFTKPEFTFTGN